MSPRTLICVRFIWYLSVCVSSNVCEIKMPKNGRNCCLPMPMANSIIIVKTNRTSVREYSRWWERVCVRNDSECHGTWKYFMDVFCYTFLFLFFLFGDQNRNRTRLTLNLTDTFHIYYLRNSKTFAAFLAWQPRGWMNDANEEKSNTFNAAQSNIMHKESEKSVGWNIESRWLDSKLVWRMLFNIISY